MATALPLRSGAARSRRQTDAGDLGVGAHVEEAQLPDGMFVPPREQQLGRATPLRTAASSVAGKSASV